MRLRPETAEVNSTYTASVVAVEHVTPRAIKGFIVCIDAFQSVNELSRKQRAFSGNRPRSPCARDEKILPA